ncbi:hypothetical protein T4D_4293 [Trichinella pseudospiralis]|uniref:Uncharacterized protein n=1 Tax=Trichinella pseudospiralis TaxID=6337 RepID=A0A0V1F974_TRIPS|nr:hypothetical protein T4D_4293 [Trichinella pseudospiralis]
MTIYFEQQVNQNAHAVRSANGIIRVLYPSYKLQSIKWDRETSEFNGNREILHLFLRVSGEQAKENERKKKNVQNGMESADCLWSHYVQNEMHALNFLAILDIKYTVIYLFFHFTFYVKFFWFSKTYKQLIQVLAEVQHDLWLYSHVSLLSSVRG